MISKFKFKLDENIGDHPSCRVVLYCCVDVLITMMSRRKVLCYSFERRIILLALFSLTGVLHIHSLLSRFILESSKDLNLHVIAVDVTIGNSSKTNQALRSRDPTKNSMQSSMSTDAMNTGDPCFGKEQLVAMIRTASRQAEDQASKVRITEKLCQDLPTWNEVTRLYGEEPVILGLDTCQQYRDMLSKDNIEPKPRVAGLFNTGTNAMARSLRMNLKFLSFRVPYEVPWGKHVPAAYKSSNTFPLNNRDSKEHVLPIVMVRDPYRWMISMVSQNKVIRNEF